MEPNLGRAKKEKDMEAGSDWWTLWGEDNWSDQTFNLLREPWLEGVPRAGDCYHPPGGWGQLC